MNVILEEVTKSFGTQVAVNQISFSAKQGNILGFLGPNGAGKSTTMKMITGYLKPDSGRILVGQYDVTNEPLSVRKQIGYLPEHNPLYLDMYVHEFLAFSGELFKIKNLKAAIKTSIHQTGLEREQHKKIGALSKGYRQRVGLASALLHNPAVLILDEPTGGLDPIQIVEIRQLIKTLGKEKTIIFSSHILPEVEAIADHVVIINRGHIVADAPINKVGNLQTLFESLIKYEPEVSPFV